MTAHLMNSTNFKGMNIFTIFVVGLFVVIDNDVLLSHFDIYHSFFWAEVVHGFEIFPFCNL